MTMKLKKIFPTLNLFGKNCTQFKNMNNGGLKKQKGVWEVNRDGQERNIAILVKSFQAKLI